MTCNQVSIISAWFNSWSFKILSEEKYCDRFVSSSIYPLPCHYVLEGNTMVKSDSYEDLGTLISDNLNFTTHLN